jgi:hypothetical protein
MIILLCDSICSNRIFNGIIENSIESIAYQIEFIIHFLNIIILKNFINEGTLCIFLKTILRHLLKFVLKDLIKIFIQNYR